MIAPTPSQDKFLNDVAYHFSPLRDVVDLKLDLDTIETSLGLTQLAQSNDESGNFFTGGFHARKLIAYLNVLIPNDENGLPYAHIGYSIVELPNRGHRLSRRDA